jgi:predicted ArsR family transcriptional regulator
MIQAGKHTYRQTSKQEVVTMPIDIDTFEHEDQFDESPPHAKQIVAFLAANSDQAFQRGEIADATGIDPNTVSSVLSRLKNRNLVRHKPPYWAIGDRDRVTAAFDLSQDIRTFDEQFGEEEMEAWRTAGSDEAHPSDGNNE